MTCANDYYRDDRSRQTTNKNNKNFTCNIIEYIIAIFDSCESRLQFGSGLSKLIDKLFLLTLIVPDGNIIWVNVNTFEYS